jgi:DNA-binding transcriptional ArsR family regulator
MLANMSGERVRLNAASLRGLAHPLRVRMLGALREHGPATATTLAERLGQSTGATSYHLRQLAAHGFVEEDEGRGAGRERWWKAAHSGTLFESELTKLAPQEAEAYVRAVAAMNAEAVDRWLNESSTLDKEWNEVSTISNFRLRLTKEQGLALHNEIFGLIKRYRSYGDPGPEPEGCATVVFQVQLMPFAPALPPAGPAEE